MVMSNVAVGDDARLFDSLIVNSGSIARHYLAVNGLGYLGINISMGSDIYLGYSICMKI